MLRRQSFCLFVCLRLQRPDLNSLDELHRLVTEHAAQLNEDLGFCLEKLRSQYSSRGPTPAPGLGSPHATYALGLGSPVPHLHRDWARLCHIGAGTGLTPATSAPELGSPLPHPRRDWARPRHIRAGTGRYLIYFSSFVGPFERIQMALRGLLSEKARHEQVGFGRIWHRL